MEKKELTDNEMQVRIDKMQEDICQFVSYYKYTFTFEMLEGEDGHRYITPVKFSIGGDHDTIYRQDVDNQPHKLKDILEYHSLPKHYESETEVYYNAW